MSTVRFDLNPRKLAKRDTRDCLFLAHWDISFVSLLTWLPPSLLHTDIFSHCFVRTSFFVGIVVWVTLRMFNAYSWLGPWDKGINRPHAREALSVWLLDHILREPRLLLHAYPDIKQCLLEKTSIAHRIKLRPCLHESIWPGPYGPGTPDCYCSFATDFNHSLYLSGGEVSSLLQNLCPCSSFWVGKTF